MKKIKVSIFKKTSGKWGFSGILIEGDLNLIFTEIDSDLDFNTEKDAKKYLENLYRDQNFNLEIK